MEPVAWLNPRSLSGTCGTGGVVSIRERHSCQKRIPAHFKNGAAQWRIKRNVVWTVIPQFTPSTIPTVPRLNPRNLSGTCGISGVVEPKEIEESVWNPVEPVAWLNPRNLCASCGTSGVVERKEPVWNLWNQWRVQPKEPIWNLWNHCVFEPKECLEPFNSFHRFQKFLGFKKCKGSRTTGSTGSTGSTAKCSGFSRP